MLHRLLLIVFTLFAFFSTAQGAQPNVLVIMADDCTYNDLPVYGGQNARTPSLDRLATQSLTFDKSYLCSAMCQPCRAELFTGQYPMTNGCAWNHSASRATTQSLPQYLKPLGYRVGIAGKVHVLPQKAFPFEDVPGYDSSCVRNPTTPHDPAGITEFMLRDTQQPFCLVVALVEPHVPWVMGDATAYPPQSLKLPPNIADTEVTRDAYSHYLAEITYMDQQVGEILEIIQTNQLDGNTVVFFTSEQGAQFPGCKWTNYDTGVHTALMCRWPGVVQPDSRTSALVQYADIAPTIVEIAGGKTADFPFDGHSILPVLRGETQHHRQFVYGMHNNFPEGPSYPIRSVSDGQFRYITNLTPDEIYIEKHVMGRESDGRLNNTYWGTWVWDSQTSKRSYDLVRRYMLRPSEEFYRIADDPYEMHNLVHDPQHQQAKDNLKTQLGQWMTSQKDPGIELDTKESHNAAKKVNHRF